MKQQRSKTYEATIRGRKTRVTVPEDPKPKDILADAVHENLSPQATAAVSSVLRTASTKSDDVNRQIQWFADLLTDVVGGGDQQNRLCEEVGL